MCGGLREIMTMRYLLMVGLLVGVGISFVPTASAEYCAHTNPVVGVNPNECVQMALNYEDTAYRLATCTVPYFVNCQIDHLQGQTCPTVQC